jgi:hypothetical protein
MLSPSKMREVIALVISLNFIVSLETLFYMTTVASNFPLVRLTYKISTCNEQHFFYESRVCLPVKNISSTFFEYGRNQI